MARVMAMHDVKERLTSTLSAMLRVVDEVIVLPQAHQSIESGTFKNVVMRLDGSETGLDPNVFSINMFAGVSAIRVPNDVAERLLCTSEGRVGVLERLTRAITSEVTASDVQVGPELDGDACDRDVSEWRAGFDGPGCCVGLYSAQEARAPQPGVVGMHRAHDTYYLVCKAGGGIATQTFHSRLVSALAEGKSLDECFAPGASPGAQALRRVASAAERNRNRILVQAAEAIGFREIDTISDAASCDGASYRLALPVLNTHTSTLRLLEGSTRRSVWQYASGCVDSLVGLGVVVASNATEGFVAFSDADADSFKVQVRNHALGCVPFASERLLSNRDAAMCAARAWRADNRECTGAHPDHAWVRERFLWTDVSSPDGRGVTIEPPPLWGAFASETFVATWGRELGISGCRAVRLKPEIVTLSGHERSKLRAARQFITA